MSKGKAQARSQTLVGRGFHKSADDRSIINQGHIIAEISPGMYLLQFFEWVMGYETTQELYSIEQLAARHENGLPVFEFYDTIERMNDYYETYGESRKSKRSKATTLSVMECSSSD